MCAQLVQRENDIGGVYRRGAGAGETRTFAEPQVRRRKTSDESICDLCGWEEPGPSQSLRSGVRKRPCSPGAGT